MLIALLYHVFRGYKAVVKALIQAGADVNCAGEMGNTPLHLAAAGDHAQVPGI